MRIHIIGIAGTKTAPLAKLLVDQGHQVTGSDQEKIFPPISTILDKAGITANSSKIDTTIDLVIVGNVYDYFENTRSEFELVKKLKIPFVSYTEYIVKNLIKKNSILVAGSYGKTTITGLLSYIFLQLNLDPSYMFGGEPQDNFFPTNFGKSEWSIIEADENHNGLDTQTTFLYYPVKYLILTSAYWEHKDSYTSAEASLQAYLKLIKNVPEDGVIIYNGNDPDLQKIIHQSHAKTINYQNGEKYKSRLIGQYNQENIAAAFCLSKYLNFDTENVLLAIASFPGIKRRLEIISETKNIIFIDDFAQSPNRVLSAIQAITYSYPKRNIHVYFESRATFLQNKESLRGFQKITPFISDFILGKLQFSAKINKDHRASALDWQTEIGTKCKYLPIDNEVSKYFQDTLKPNDILVHFSSGGLQGLETYQQIVTYFQK